MTSQRTTIPSEDREYRMAVAGQIFKHLGLQMYSGAVPAISELISNAYDAMAKNVWIEIPTGRSIQQTDEIVVRDDGHGMTHQECKSLYLVAGRDRRSQGQNWSREYNGLKPRKVQGRKGIGKFGVFGIADRITIRTIGVDKDVAHFALDFPGLTASPNFTDMDGYLAETLSDDGRITDELPGTTVTLSQLKIRRAINEEQFKRSIARRLLVLNDDFTVHVNGLPMSRQEIPLQFRFPENSGQWAIAELTNGQQIQWWAGFCKDTITIEEQRGFVVYVRGKLAQTPWVFDLSGGVWGQHGMQYLTGEIQADFLDDSVDLISTDRGTVRWEDPIAVPLKEWGRKQVRLLLEEWTNKRRKKKAQSPKIKMYLQQADSLPDRERRIFKSVVDRICAIPQLDKDREGRDIADELVEFAYNAMTSRSFLEAIRQLNTASAGDVTHFEEVLSEWDIIEAVNTAHLVKGRVEIIRTFEQMIQARVPEKPDMQDYLRDHPWLIDPKWTMLAHEQSLDRVLRERFGEQSSGEREGAGRLDFFCLGDRNQEVYVVEVKRPGYPVGREEIRQVEDYVQYLIQRLQDDATRDQDKRSVVKGLLIAGHIRSGQRGYIDRMAGTVDFRTWENLLIATKSMHEEFLEVVKRRAPTGDPRMMELSVDD